MKDIVERLRRLAEKDELVGRRFHLPIDEAADEIERLRKELGKSNKYADHLGNESARCEEGEG